MSFSKIGKKMLKQSVMGS